MQHFPDNLNFNTQQNQRESQQNDSEILKTLKASEDFPFPSDSKCTNITYDEQVDDKRRKKIVERGKVHAQHNIIKWKQRG